MSAGLAVGSSEYLTTAMWTAFFLFIWTAIGGFATCWFYGKGKALKKGFVAVAIMAVIQGGGELLLTQVSYPEFLLLHRLQQNHDS